ncbi:hypothetical protein [Desulfosporosinus sp. OT]|uniref:hypothetical protein n=1 Tax=Desulfosporosinus sp. OT TaxID=913865 RepID=UPI0002E4BEA4|nr:hypothetical protein [Desulfosporosinus sp. OT]
MSIYTNMNSKTLKVHRNKFKRVAESMRNGIFKHDGVSSQFNDEVNKSVHNMILELENEINSRN